MKSKYALVLVTAPDHKTGRLLARAAIEARLAACVNLVPQIESHYWWKGVVESGRETLLVIKTTCNRLPALQRLILAEHPYDTPEFLVLPIAQGSRRYLDWITSSVRPMRHPPRERAARK